jgi:hypothetical protein
MACGGVIRDPACLQRPQIEGFSREEESRVRSSKTAQRSRVAKRMRACTVRLPCRRSWVRVPSSAYRSAAEERRRVDLVGDALPARAVGPRSDSHRAELLDRSLGPSIRRVDQEDHALHEPEGVSQHQTLQLAVVGAAPARSGEERPPDLDFASSGVVAVEARHADHVTSLRVEGHERSPGGKLLVEEDPEDVFPVAIADGMLLPDRGIGRDGEQRREVLRSERPQLEQIAGQHRLQVERHVTPYGARVTVVGTIVILRMTMAQKRTSKVLAVSVPPAAADEFDRIAEAEGRNKSELFREMLRIYRGYRETGTFESLQRYGAAQARRLGVRDERDVERLIHEARGR